MNGERGIIHGIHQAAVIPEQWPGVLEAVSRRTGSASGSVFIHREGVPRFAAMPAAGRPPSDVVTLLCKAGLGRQAERVALPNGKGIAGGADV